MQVPSRYWSAVVDGETSSKTFDGSWRRHRSQNQTLLASERRLVAWKLEGTLSIETFRYIATGRDEEKGTNVAARFVFFSFVALAECLNLSRRRLGSHYRSKTCTISLHEAQDELVIYHCRSVPGTSLEKHLVRGETVASDFADLTLRRIP